MFNCLRKLYSREKCLILNEHFTLLTKMGDAANYVFMMLLKSYNKQFLLKVNVLRFMWKWLVSMEQLEVTGSVKTRLLKVLGCSKCCREHIDKIKSGKLECRSRPTWGRLENCRTLLNVSNGIITRYLNTSNNFFYTNVLPSYPSLIWGGVLIKQQLRYLSWALTY